MAQLTLAATQFPGFGPTVASTASYQPWGDSGAYNSQNSVEALAQIPINSSNTLSTMYARVSGNGAATATIQFRVNGGNGNQVISIGSSATGEFTDAVNTDSVSAGNLLDYAVTSGVTSLRMFALSTLISNGSNYVTKYVASQNNGTSIVTSAFTYFVPLSGEFFQDTTEAHDQCQVFFTATFSNLFSYVQTNTTTSSSTMRFRKNTANGNQIVSISAGATGLFQDTVNTDTVANGNLVNYSMKAGSSASLVVWTLGAEMSSSTNSQWHALNGTSQNSATTHYLHGQGYCSTPSATETNFEIKTGLTNTLSNLNLNVVSNSIAATGNFNLRKNAGAANQSVSITASTTGQFTDSTHTDGIVASDEVDLQIVTGGSSGSVNFFDFSVTTVVASTTTTQTQLGKSRITATTTQTQPGKARITVTTNQSQQGLSRIQAITAKLQTAKSRIQVTTSQTQAGRARITSVTAQVQTGKSRITALSSQTQPGKARLTNVALRAQAGVARLTSQTPRTQLGRSRIRVTTSQTIAGSAHITLVTSQTVSGRSNVRNSSRQTTTGVARVMVLSQQAVTGVAHIVGVKRYMSRPVYLSQSNDSMIKLKQKK